MGELLLNIPFTVLNIDDPSIEFIFQVSGIKRLKDLRFHEIARSDDKFLQNGRFSIRLTTLQNFLLSRSETSSHGPSERVPILSYSVTGTIDHNIPYFFRISTSTENSLCTARVNYSLGETFRSKNLPDPDIAISELPRIISIQGNPDGLWLQNEGRFIWSSKDLSKWHQTSQQDDLVLQFSPDDKFETLGSPIMASLRFEFDNTSLSGCNVELLENGSRIINLGRKVHRIRSGRYFALSSDSPF
eukprot:Sdes_comp18952_c0_seq2m9465